MSHHEDWASHLDPDVAERIPFGSAVDGLDRVAETLSDPALWDEPPASLRDRILAEAAGEAAGRAGESSFDLGRPQRPEVVTPARLRARARWFTPILVAAAVVAVALVAWPRIAGESVGNVTTFEVAGTELAPNASATVDVEPLGPGVAITLNIVGLAPAGEGEYYAGWLTGPDGQVGIGSFHWREGGIPIELWSGVDVERYPTLGVTLQREGEPTTSNGELVLKGLLVASPGDDGSTTGD